MFAVLILAVLCQPDTIVLKGGKVITISAGEIDNAVVIIEAGKIKSIGKATQIPQDVTVIDLPSGSVIVPGFIDAHSHLASLFEVEESTESITPHMKAVEAFTSTHADVRSALASGVTLIALSPGNGNLVGGRIALLRMNGKRLDQMIVSDDVALKLSLGEEAFRRDREPTSRSGAMHLLRQILSDPASEISKSLLEKRQPAFIHATQVSDILRVIEIKESLGARAVLVHGDEAAQVADRLAKAGLAVAFGPLMVGDSRDKLESAAVLAKAGVRLAFVTDAPRTAESQLRTTAALAVRYGLDRERALRSLTLDAAEMLGVADRFGSVEAGKAADLVVYDGDPLSLASAVEMVLVEGRIVHKRPKK